MTTASLKTKKTNQKLARRLLRLVRASSKVSRPRVPTVPQDADAIVSHVEVNEHHGVGVLLKRLFGHYDDVLSIRSRDLYGGSQAFGAMHVCISHSDTAKEAIFRTTFEALRGATVKRVLSVPYYADDVRTAIAVKELFGASLCTYIMDDQNLHADGIPDDLMHDLLAKSSLRLGISPELCTAYEVKYGFRMWYMPPLVPTSLILREVNPLAATALRKDSPVIIGNIWGRQWLESLRRTVRGSGIAIRWYNNGRLEWLSCTKEELAGDGIDVREGAGDGVVDVLRHAPFVIVPSGTLDEDDDRRFIAQLSLPSRVPYVLATSHAPILVLGSANTAVARFVSAAGIGMVSPYDQKAFREAIERISNPDTNLKMRQAALGLAVRFADDGAAEWLWQSLANGEPIDGRYEEMMPERRADAEGSIPRPLVH
jgi:hypothetical protein